MQPPRVRWLPVTAALTMLTAGLSCYPGEVESLSELDLSIAIRNPTVPESEFGAIQTYAMPDTVLHIYPDTSDPNPPSLSRAYDDYILGLIESHFESRGYERVSADPGNPPDVLVLVAATARTFTGAVWYPGYWYGWYWPPYSPCYYCGYPGGYWDTYEWDQGSVVITMADPAAPTDSTIRALWFGAVNGVLGGTPGAATQSRLETGINRVFELSPYLRSN